MRHTHARTTQMSIHDHPSRPATDALMGGGTQQVLETPIREKLARIAQIAPGGCSMGIRIRFGRPALLHYTYHPGWMKQYLEQNLYLCDPTIVWGVASSGEIRWSELERRFPDPFGVFEKARKFDLNYGIVVSTGTIGSRSVAGLAHNEREFTDEETAEYKKIIGEIHDIVCRRKPLLETHLRALELYSYGYSYDEICDRLHISRTALKSRLSGARKRLGAHSNVEAVRIATENHLLRPVIMTGTNQAV